MTIDCPSGGMKVLVTAPGPISGSVGTICVCGTAPQQLLPKPPLAAAALKIRVRVLNGHVAPGNLPNADPPKPEDVEVPVAANWCAKKVPVPAASAGGSPLTAVAWEQIQGSGGVTWGPAVSVQFLGGGANPTDCCSGCGATAADAMSAELATSDTLAVTVPDGPNAGQHSAKASGTQTWSVTLGGVEYQLYIDPAAGLVLRGRDMIAPSSSQDSHPFSASFPGAALGAKGDVVVTQP